LKTLGRHMILELWGCSNLNSVEVVEDALRDIVDATNTTLLDLRVYPFTPIGVTGVAIVSESHIMIHTWPEHGYAAVDVFTCGDEHAPEEAMPAIKRHFSPERVQVMEMNRGVVSEMAKVPVGV
jgi:S-adenosylmethionine decarboxylase